MEDRDLYRQTHQNELKVWKADLAGFKKRVLANQNNMQHTLDEKIVELEQQMINAQELLTMLADADEGLWTSLKEKIETAWHSAKSTYIEVAWLASKANYLKTVHRVID